MKTLTKNMLSKKAENIIDSINNISNRIPQKGFYELGNRLKLSMNEINHDLEAIYNQNKTAKLLAGIKAKSKIDECESYLKLINTMKYADTNEVISELEDLKKWLMLEAELSKSKRQISEYTEAS